MTNITANAGSDVGEMTGSSDLDTVEDPISVQIRTFLTNRNIQRHKHVLTLSQKCGVSRTTIHRKFKGEGTSWDADDLQSIADAFGVTVDQLTGEDADGAIVPASIKIPRCPTSGLLVVGDLLDKSDVCDLVAIEGPIGWEVHPLALVPKAPDRYAVKKLTLSSLAYTRLALLEDNESAAESLADGLKDFGFAVTVFASNDAFLDVLPQGNFKAYILDWDLGGSTSGAALAAIRDLEAKTSVHLARRAPIIVTTGTLVGTDQRTGQELYAATERFSAQIQTKPTPASLLATVIQRLLTRESR